MPYRKIMQELFESEKILGCVILDPNGNIWWHRGFFPQKDERPLDGYYLLSEWVTYPSYIMFCGVDYESALNSYPNTWILNNEHGYGSVVLQKAPKNGYYFLCYIRNPLDPHEVQQEIQKMADLFG